MSRRTLSLRGIVRAREMRAGSGTPAAAGDPDFANVVLLLDFAGADGATDITDLSDSAHAETFAGIAEVDTAAQFLGENSLQCGANGYIHYADHADWDFPGNFTIELGLYRPPAATSRGVVSCYGASEGWAFQIGDPGGGQTDLNFIVHGSEVMSRATTITQETFYHIAFCRSGSDLRLFKDGVQLGATVTNSTSIAGTKVLALGVLIPVGTQLFKGSIGAVRITKGVARYTANFTPPTEFYPTS